MIADAALEISNCDTITLTANTFDAIQAMASTTLGEAVAVKVWGNNAYKFDARFNMFKNCNAGIHIMTGAYNTHSTLGSATFVVPTGSIEYNRFTGGAKYAMALADLGKDSSNREGALQTDGTTFNTATASGTITAKKNWFGDASGPSGTNKVTAVSGGKGIDTSGHMTSADDDCIGPLAVWNNVEGSSSDCFAGRSGCTGTKNKADMKYRKCVETCATG
jgi:hypothetical protein